jgi:hypothetical protein
MRIRESVTLPVKLEGENLGVHTFLVVEDGHTDTPIPCDAIIGKPLLAESDYPLIDARHNKLRTLDGKKEIKLHRAAATLIACPDTGTKRRQLRPLDLPHGHRHGAIIDVVDSALYTVVTCVDNKAEQLVKLVFNKQDDEKNGFDSAMHAAENDHTLETPLSLSSSASPEVADKIKKEIEKFIEKDCGECDAAQKQQFKHMLLSNHRAFSHEGHNMGNCSLVEHEIDTGTSRPFKEQLRVHPDAVHQVIDDEVERMLKLDVIEPCASPWASNVLIVWKADGKPRFCIDYRRLNDKTIKDHYPLPNIQYIYRQVGHSSWFSTVDLESGFWQLLVKPSDRAKTAFITPKGQYQFKRVPFGLCNAPSSFQRMMDHVIEPDLRAFLKAYVDDILAHSDSFEDHLKHVDALLKRLIACGLSVKLCKCKFCRKIIKFLGCMISKNKLQADLSKTKVISDWQRLTSVKATRMFLGLANYYRNFIPHFARHAEPLYELLRKDAPFTWGRAQELAFARIKRALTQAPTLALPDTQRDYILRTDASDTAVSAILVQKDSEGNEHPIAFGSHTLNSAQRNYTVTEREMLALVWGLEHYRPYLFRKLTWVTDHSALTHLIKPGRDSPNQRIARWVLKLQDFDIRPLHTPGKSLP